MFKKFILACSLATIATSSYAGATGWYAGLQGGGANTDYNNASKFFKNPNNVTGTTSTSNTDNGAVGRVNLGYQFNKYIAAELGYSYFEQYKFNHLFGNANASGEVLQQTGDLLLKPVLPLSNKIDLFAIGGAAYVSASATRNSGAKALGITAQSEHGFRPTYGAGAEWYFADWWSVDASWRRIQSNSNIPESNEALIGIAYHFHNPDAEPNDSL